MSSIQRAFDRLDEELIVQADSEVSSQAERLQPRINAVCDEHGLCFTTRPPHKYAFFYLDGPLGGQVVSSLSGRSSALHKIGAVATESAREAIAALRPDLHAKLSCFAIPLTDYLSSYDPREP